MSIGKFFRDLTTNKDNTTHDVGRTYIVVMMIMTPIVTIWGCALETWHSYTVADHSFDLQSFFQAVSTLWLGIGAFMMSGAYSLKLKQSTDTTSSAQDTTLTQQESTTVLTTKG